MYLLASSLATAATWHGASRRAGVGRVRLAAILSILDDTLVSSQPSMPMMTTGVKTSFPTTCQRSQEDGGCPNSQPMGDCVVSEASLGKRIVPWAERLIDGEKVLLFCARKKEVSQPLANGRAPSAAFVLVDQAAEKLCTQIV
jgi:hypothetical protein